MTQISRKAKVVASRTAAAFGVDRPPILHMWDDDHRSDLHVMEAANRPQEGVVSYATIGLSEHPLVRDGKEFGTRVELLGACGAAFPEFKRVLATLGFCIINSKWFCAPGIIFPGVVDMYGASTTMSDIYFASPFVWGEGFRTMTIDDQAIAWLLAVPVSKKETDFAGKYGPAKLEELFSTQDIDLYDLNRPSIVL
jgi:antitoxin YqcF